MRASGTTFNDKSGSGGANGTSNNHDNFTRSLNLNVRGIGQSATLSIQARCRKLFSQGAGVTNFGLGQSPFPVPKPVVEALRLHAHEKDYLPVHGLPALRDAVAAFHARLDGIDATGDLVLVGPGSKELMFLLQVVFYGELILPSPCWVSYGPQARILGKQIRVIPTRFEQRWRLTAGTLDAFLESEADDSRPRILVLNYPGNPDGLSYSVEELKAIAEVARNWNLVVLSDEIYGQIHHRGEHVSIARFYPEGTIISSGLSKWCGAGGWRLGTMTFPPDLAWLLESMAAVASETYTSVSAPIQHAAVHAFKGGVEIERYLRHTRRVLSGLASRGFRVLQDSGILLHEPVGAFYLFLNFEPLRERMQRRGIHTGKQLCETLLAEASVAVLPGSAFERSCEELTARLSYVNFDGGAALATSEATALCETLSDNFFEQHCAKTLAGFRKIAAWAQKAG
ncbi:MAG: pyridoxal phosphate-dependent aminotransferase [Deltaproteobacteria bacterium]|nr:pyridoxal phosphate-dependent aminotransferase [Deltaproteobacteria bacterium]